MDQSVAGAARSSDNGRLDGNRSGQRGGTCPPRLSASSPEFASSGRRAVDGPVAHIVPLLLDVTNPGQIAAAAETVGRSVGDAGLAGLVNNAGIVVAGPLEILPLDQLRLQLEVNVVGQVAVMQAFLPLLRKARGAS